MFLDDSSYDSEFKWAMQQMEASFAIEQQQMMRETHAAALDRRLQVRRYQQWLTQGAIDLAAFDEEIAASQSDLVREYPEAQEWLGQLNEQLQTIRRKAWEND